MSTNYCQVEQQWRFLAKGEIIQEGDRYAIIGIVASEIARPNNTPGPQPIVGQKVYYDNIFVRAVPWAEPKISFITVSSTDSITEFPQKLPVGAYGWVGGPVAGQAAVDDFEFNAKAEECRFKYVIAEDAAEKAIAHAKISLDALSVQTGIPLQRVKYLFSEDECDYELHYGDGCNPDWVSEALTVGELARIGLACGVVWYLVGQDEKDTDLTRVDTRPPMSPYPYCGLGDMSSEDIHPGAFDDFDWLF
jgi:hypothetical protein